jgi:hypothetical protein
MPPLEKQKLNLKIYIRLLLYVKDKYEKLQNSSQISSSLIEYLKNQIRENKEYNDELRYNQNDALDDTFTTLTQRENIRHILSSGLEPGSHEDTKTRMSKLVEELLTSIKTIRNDKKRSYLDRELGRIKKEDLKTLDEVLGERRAYFYDKYDKDKTNKDKTNKVIIETIETIDNIRIVIGIESGGIEPGEEY